MVIFCDSLHQVTGQKKPISSGIRVYAIAGEGGYVFDTSFHLADGTKISEHVLKLVKTLTAEGHIIALDNLFTSTTLFKTLKTQGINVCGTNRNGRGAPYTKEEASSFLEKKGDYIEMWSDDIRWSCWLDGGPATMMTTFGDDIRPTSVKRREPGCHDRVV